jgi:hypothetical protein
MDYGEPSGLDFLHPLHSAVGFFDCSFHGIRDGGGCLLHDAQEFFSSKNLSSSKSNVPSFR